MNTDCYSNNDNNMHQESPGACTGMCLYWTILYSSTQCCTSARASTAADKYQQYIQPAALAEHHTGLRQQLETTRAACASNDAGTQWSARLAASTCCSALSAAPGTTYCGATLAKAASDAMPQLQTHSGSRGSRGSGGSSRCHSPVRVTHLPNVGAVGLTAAYASRTRALLSCHITGPAPCQLLLLLLRPERPHHIPEEPLTRCHPDGS